MVVRVNEEHAFIPTVRRHNATIASVTLKARSCRRSAFFGTAARFEEWSGCMRERGGVRQAPIQSLQAGMLSRCASCARAFSRGTQTVFRSYGAVNCGRRALYDANIPYEARKHRSHICSRRTQNAVTRSSGRKSAPSNLSQSRLDVVNGRESAPIRLEWSGLTSAATGCVLSAQSIVTRLEARSENRITCMSGAPARYLAVW